MLLIACSAALNIFRGAVTRPKSFTVSVIGGVGCGVHASRLSLGAPGKQQKNERKVAHFHT